MCTRMAMIALMILAVAGLSGCGGSSARSSGESSTGEYPVAIYTPSTGKDDFDWNGWKQRKAAILASAEIRNYKTVGEHGLNLYMYHNSAAEPRPVVLLVPSFGNGHDRFASMLDRLRQLGVTAASMTHTPKGSFVERTRDVRDAIIYLRDHAEELGIRGDAIMVGGQSAGSHLACGATVVPAYHEEVGHQRGKADALFLMEGGHLSFAAIEGHPQFGTQPGYFTPERVGGDPLAWSPYHHFAADTPPAILVIGTEDARGRVLGAYAAHQHAVELGLRWDLHMYHGIKHSGNYKGELFTPRAFDALTMEVIAFMERVGLFER